MNTKFKYQCTTCGKEFPGEEIIYLCSECEHNYPENPPKGVLKVCYDYDRLKLDGCSFAELFKNHFLDLLPVQTLESFPELQIGQTPLYSKEFQVEGNSSFGVYLKDDSQNPTYSFKDRASALVSAYAEENEIATIVTASTGNAGSSIAGICAAQGQNAVVIVPSDAPIAKLTQIIMYGATLIPVKGTYDDAFDLSVQASKEFGWYNRNTAYNPLTIEGKKTVTFELFHQLGEEVPDTIFVPVGDGVIISGLYKGFEDLLKLEIIKDLPKVIAVQASGSDNLIRNLDTETFESKESETIADSISVDFPRNFYMTKDYLTTYNGEWIAVSDDEILGASSFLAQSTGLFTEPASAAAYAGMVKYAQKHKIKPNSKNVVLLTGCGLKDISSLQKDIKIPDAIEPDVKNIERR
jgi:threonine synthase